jgi:hypothetical protein
MSKGNRTVPGVVNIVAVNVVIERIETGLRRERSRDLRETRYAPLNGGIESSLAPSAYNAAELARWM